MSTVVCYQLNILILLLLQHRIVREKRVRSLVKNVCKAIIDHLGPKYIKKPTGAELTESVKRFEDDLGFPQVLGAVDVTHIPIQQPNENSHSFFFLQNEIYIECTSCL
jgi:hypothetical protein